MLGETLRAALEDLASVAPQWLRSWVPADWFERYSHRIELYYFPKEQTARERLGKTYGLDGWRLLRQLYRHPAPLWLRELPAVQTLRLMWLQQFVVSDGHLRLRTAEELPPSALRIASPYDIEARYSDKRSVNWVGYKVHLTETCGGEQPNLITNVQTTLATVADTVVVEQIHAALAAQDLLPSEHMMDGAYGDSENLLSSKQQHDVTVLSPLTGEVSWQAKSGAGYAASDFTIDWANKQAICPAGKRSSKWRASQDKWGGQVYKAIFAAADCGACAAKALCTQAQVQGRSVSVRPQEQQQVLQTARQVQTSAEWQHAYQLRAGIEGTLSAGIGAHGLRQSRYIGLAKTHLQALLVAIAMNLVRIVAYLNKEPRATTRTSHFARLAPVPA